MPDRLMPDRLMQDRRLFLQGAGAGLLSSVMGGKIAFAQAPTEKRLVVLFLRGGMDGLHAVVPYADKNYHNLRGTIAVKDSLNINGYFGMHQSLRGLHGLYRQGELAIVPAAATQYRLRSHFDAQNMLENGSGTPFGASDGWLNRAIVGLNGGDRRMGLALGKQVPLILQGASGIQTWSQSGLDPVSDDFLSRLSLVYAGDETFAKALADARETAGASDMMGKSMSVNTRRKDDLIELAEAAGMLMSQPGGPRIAVMESVGWDTHYDQERRIKPKFQEVSDAVLALKKSLGAHWNQTAVLIVSEFGRTAAENGNRGTDHGTGGVAMIAGGAVKGGQILGKWPGLSRYSLFQKRDVRAENDYEGIFKSVLISHLGLTDSFVADTVLPGNKSKPMEGLIG